MKKSLCNNCREECKQPAGVVVQCPKFKPLKKKRAQS